MEFKLSRLSDYSDTALCAELRRVATLVPEGLLTKQTFDLHSRASASAINKRFGGWREALLAAGLGDRYSGAPVSSRMREQPGKSLSAEDCLNELRRVAETLGKTELTVHDFAQNASFSPRPVRKHFGSWRKALVAAGLEGKPSSARYTDEECFENLLQVWTHHGRPPKYSEMSEFPSKVGGKAYIVRWGKWVPALEAFVARINSDPQEPEYISAPTERGVPVTPAKPASEKAKIPLGLRYRVLARDNFKCIKCGDSPATNPRCKLHVDHIVPFSLGGLTVELNLRSLCEACNLGKSNLLIESEG